MFIAVFNSVFSAKKSILRPIRPEKYCVNFLLMLKMLRYICLFFVASRNKTAAKKKKFNFK